MRVVAIHGPERLRLVLGELHIASDDLRLVRLNVLAQNCNVVVRHRPSGIGIRRACAGALNVPKAIAIVNNPFMTFIAYLFVIPLYSTRSQATAHRVTQVFIV
jgi:hypothetical protein